ncbi:hypothetical protein ACFLWW_03025 [Chloroflexota bacterium]
MRIFQQYIKDKHKQHIHISFAYVLHWLIKSDYPKLLLILGLAFYITFIPHLDYPYPLHLDEWTHWACCNTIIDQANVTGLNNPFLGGAPLENQIFEVGFHSFWAVFQKISGLPWLFIFRYFPSFIFLSTILAVYIFAKKQGFGWEAAFFTCMIPTSVGILGPSFLIPVASTLPFIVLSLYIAFYSDGWRLYVLLFIFFIFLLVFHSTSAIGLLIILIPFILINLKDNLWHSLGIFTPLITACLLVFLVVIPQIWSELVIPSVESLFEPNYPLLFVEIPWVISEWGYIPAIFGLIGTFVLWVKGGVRNRGLVLGLLVLLLVLVTFYTLHYGIAEVYYRCLIYMMLVMGIVAGAGLMAIKNLKLPERLSVSLKVNKSVKYFTAAMCITVIVFTLYFAIPIRLENNYYHMIDSEDYQGFIWIRDNIGDSYTKAILDPWKATAFTAITGKNVYSWLSIYPQPADEEAYKFLSGKASNTAFLKNNGISIVYTTGEVNNPDLKEVRKHVYLLEGE